MAITINNVGKNVFPQVEEVETKAIEGGHEVTLHIRIEGQLTPVVIKLSDEQARKLSNLLALSQYRR
jgi:hypothetical protein